MRTKPLPPGPKVRCIASGLRAHDDMVTTWASWPIGQRERAENAICPMCGRDVLLFMGNRYRRHLRMAGPWEVPAYMAFARGSAAWEAFA